jgi:hypothetical protein
VVALGVVQTTPRVPVASGAAHRGCGHPNDPLRNLTSVRKILSAMLATALPLASFDAGRIVLQALVLRQLRRTHPELFDGSAAAASVAACLAEYRRAQSFVGSVS